MSSVVELHDAAVAADICDVLTHHSALRDVTHIELRVRGGVAHVSGCVSSCAERDLLRAVIARVRGVRAVWDSLVVPPGEPLRVLDVGCGNRKQIPNAIGVDCFRFGAVDVVARIERGLPFAPDALDHVYAIHFLEHVDDLLAVMNEIHRVLKPDGVLHIMVPHWQCVNAVADPTHRHLFHRQTFKFFCRPYPRLHSFRPLAVGETDVDLFADLQPIKNGGAANSEQQLARFFD
ncbi:MAG: methyltransferase domain-containing protein [Sulfurifustaceae bacterium]